MENVTLKLLVLEVIWDPEGRLRHSPDKLILGGLKLHYEIIKRLVKYGIEVIPIRSSIDIYKSQRAVYIPVPPIKPRRLSYYVLALLTALRTLKIYRELKRAKNVIVYNPGMGFINRIAVIFLRLFRVPTVSVFHHRDYPARLGDILRHFIRLGRKGYLLATLDRVFLWMALKLTNAIITPSKLSRSQLEEMGIDSSKIYPVGVGFDLSEFKTIEHEDKETYCVFVGRMAIEKGIFDLVEIWKNVTRVLASSKLWTIGLPTNYTSYWMYKVKSEGLEGNIKYLGTVPRSKLLEILAKALVFIFPSHVEGGGIAVVEAMASGLPVVAWDLPVFRELFRGAPALFLIRRGDYKAFSKTVIDLLNNRERCIKLGLENREYILSRKDLTWDSVSLKILSILRYISRTY